MKTDAKQVEILANELFEAYKYCFSADSTEKWVKMFAEKRFERIRLEELEDTGKNLSKAFEKKVVNRFAELMNEYIAQCKKQRRKKEREELDAAKEAAKKNGVKRGKNK